MESVIGKELPMQKRYKNILICVPALIVFLIRLKQGLTPPASEPSFIPSGAMNAPVAVVFSALLLSTLVWVLLELLFRIFETIKRNRS